jgi:precorrin-6B C5,15-methyltransferase / cobalt-precorrin-6B C5,C15-methyltransferase
LSGRTPPRGGAASPHDNGSVTIVGVDGGPLGPQAMGVLARAALVVGWPRHLELVRHLLPPVTMQLAIDGDLPATLQAVAGAAGHRVVLATGDPGYFGVVRAFAAQHGAVAVVPAVSSVSRAFAAAGLSWDDAQVVSAHGRPAHRAVAACRRLPKVAVLTEAAFGPAELGGALAHADRRLVVVERLGHADERITTCTPDEAAARDDWRDPNVVLVLDDGAAAGEEGWAAPPRWTAERWALPEEAFDHRGGMVTKAEVRALALAWLGPGLGDLIWDVGAGSGAVGIEAARLGAAVIAVDDDPDQCHRARTNARRHGVPLQVVEGRAPAALRDLPPPDAVFVGGGGHLLTEITRTAAERARRAVVVALPAHGRVGPVLRALDEAGLIVEATQLSAAHVTTVADGHRLAAVNPVTLIRGGRS